jgi:hypothetical protein
VNIVEARRILQDLAYGINPFTKESLPDDTLYSSPQVIRALWCVLTALDTTTRKQRSRTTPENAGKPWEKDDDDLLRLRVEEGKRSGRSQKSLNEHKAESPHVLLGWDYGHLSLSPELDTPQLNKQLRRKVKYLSVRTKRK